MRNCARSHTLVVRHVENHSTRVRGRYILFYLYVQACTHKLCATLVERGTRGWYLEICQRTRIIVIVIIVLSSLSSQFSRFSFNKLWARRATHRLLHSDINIDFMSRYQNMSEISDIVAKSVVVAIMNIVDMSVYISVADIKKKIKILKLRLDNYQVWAQIMKVNLIKRKLWDVTNESILKLDENQSLSRKTWEFDDVIVMRCIYEIVDDDQLQHIVLLQTSHEQWEKLKKIHQILEKIRLMSLMRRLNNYKISANETINHIVSEMSRIVVVITDIKSKLKSADLIMTLILMNSIDVVKGYKEVPMKDERTDEMRKNNECFNE